MDRNILLGDKFYIVDKDKIMIFRVIKLNNDKITVKELSTGNKFNVNKNVLLDNYIKLNQHGNIYLSIVELGKNNKDIILTFFRKKDTNAAGSLPYAVCRQNVENTFMTRGQIMDRYTQEKLYYIGLSVNRDNCPEDIPFEMMIACDNVVYSQCISIYMDDKFEDIMDIITHKDKYDAVLSRLYESTKQTKVLGASKDLKSLILDTGFMSDIMMGYDIFTLDRQIVSDENKELLVEQRQLLERFLNVQMFRTYVIKFDYKINLNNIKREHILVKDVNENLYIIAYDKGEYLTPIEKMKDRLFRDLKQSNMIK